MVLVNQWAEFFVPRAPGTKGHLVNETIYTLAKYTEEYNNGNLKLISITKYNEEILSGLLKLIVFKDMYSAPRK